MHRKLKRRVEQLEERSGGQSREPRKRLRLVITRADRKPSLENAECRRTLCPDGTLMELVHLENSREGHDELSEEALDRFVESFPVRNSGGEKAR